MIGLLLKVTYTTRPGMREAFLEEILKKGIDQKVREEEGCLCYVYYCALQQENEVLLMEEWESEEHQKRHMEQAHMEDLKELKNRYVLDSNIEKMQRI